MIFGQRTTIHGRGDGMGLDLRPLHDSFVAEVIGNRVSRQEDL